MSRKSLIIIGVIVLIVFLVGSSCISQYNRLITTEESVDTAWAQVENTLQRRNDLIPNLVNTVKGYASHEKEIFENVAAARAKLAGATTINEKVQANMALGGALGRLLAIVERYPDLKANQNFLALQDELAGSENRIAVERRRYNDAIRHYNLLTRRFPSSLIARFMGFEPHTYFEAEEGAKSVPEVNF